MLHDYIEKKMRLAQYRILKDRSFFGEITGLRGVWSNAETLEKCRGELQEVLEDWVFLKLRDGERIPGFHVKVDRRTLVRHA